MKEPEGPSCDGAGSLLLGLGTFFESSTLGAIEALESNT